MLSKWQNSNTSDATAMWMWILLLCPISGFIIHKWALYDAWIILKLLIIRVYKYQKTSPPLPNHVTFSFPTANKNSIPPLSKDLQRIKNGFKLSYFRKWVTLVKVKYKMTFNVLNFSILLINLLVLVVLSKFCISNVTSLINGAFQKWSTRKFSTDHWWSWT